MVLLKYEQMKRLMGGFMDLWIGEMMREWLVV